METVICPGCSRRLRLPRASLGIEAICPLCQTTFTAEAAIPEPPRPVVREVPVPDQPPPVPLPPPPEELPPPVPFWRTQKFLTGVVATIAMLIVVALWVRRLSTPAVPPSLPEAVELELAEPLFKFGGPPRAMEWNWLKRAFSPTSRVAAMLRGHLYVRAGRYEKAEEEFATGLKGRPSEKVLETFRASRVLARRATAGAIVAYTDIGPPEETFAQLAALLDRECDDGMLGRLIDLHAADHPEDGELLAARANLRARQGLVAEALADEESARGRRALHPPEARRDVLRTLATAGKGVEAYRRTGQGKDFFDMAEALVETGRVVELRALVAAHREKAAGDPWIDYFEARADLMEGDAAKAAASLERAWAALPVSKRGPVEAAYLHALCQSGQDAKAVRVLTTSAELSERLINELNAAGRGGELERLAHHLRGRFGVGRLTILAGVRGKLLLGQPERALTLYTLGQQGRAGGESLLEVLADDFVRARQAVAAYRASVDRREAFRHLAAALRDTDSGQLLALLREHQAAQPVTRAYHLAWARLYMRRKDHAQAIASFRLARRSPEDDTGRLDPNEVNEATIAAGRATELDRPDLQPAALGRLAVACARHGRLADLEALIRAYRDRFPNESVPVQARLAVLWLKRDHASLIALFRQEGRRVIADDDVPADVIGWYVRSLVRLGRAAEAVKEERALWKGGDDLLPLLANAAAGDARRAKALLNRHDHPHDTRSYHADEELGPLLRRQ